VTGEQGHYPFGESWYSSGSTTNRFTTYERDPESGLDHAIARTYCSADGRFTAPDPVEGVPEDPQSLNRYAYVLDNPVNLTDPLGLYVPWTCWDCYCVAIDDGPRTCETCCGHDAGRAGGSMDPIPPAKNPLFRPRVPNNNVDLRKTIAKSACHGLVAAYQALAGFFNMGTVKAGGFVGGTSAASGQFANGYGIDEKGNVFRFVDVAGGAGVFFSGGVGAFFSRGTNRTFQQGTGWSMNVGGSAGEVITFGVEHSWGQKGGLGDGFSFTDVSYEANTYSLGVGGGVPVESHFHLQYEAAEKIFNLDDLCDALPD
jgi:RHS repeat-associated protein